MDNLTPKEERLVKLAEAGGDDTQLVFLDEIDEIKDTLKELPTKDTIISALSPLNKISDDLATLKEKELPAPNVVVNVDDVSIKKPTWYSLTPIFDYFNEFWSKVKDATFKVSMDGGVKIIDKDNNLVDWKELFDKNIKVIGSSSGGFGLALKNPSVRKYLNGASANGTKTLTLANTWYAVPSTIPSGPYCLVVTVESAAGTVRWGFSNSGTPSATNGNQFGTDLIVRLDAAQVVYLSSSTAGDVVNWTTKVV